MFTYAALVSSVLASEVNAHASAATRAAAVETLDLLDAIDALVSALEIADGCVYLSDADATYAGKVSR